MADSQGGVENTLVGKLLQNSDLFGGDSDSETESPKTTQAQVNDAVHQQSNGPTSPLSPEPQTEVEKPKKKKKLSTKEKKPKRPKKSDIQQIYSDSQRMVRESSLNLPKYQPKTKDLASFLSRVRGRKPQSAPVVDAIKSTSQETELAQDRHTNKENSPVPAEEDFPVALDTPTQTTDHIHTPQTTNDSQSDQETTSTEDTVTEQPTTKDDGNEDTCDSKISNTEDSNEAEEVRDVDLSFSGELSPTALPSHPQIETNTTIGGSKTKRAKQTTLTSLFAPRTQLKTECSEETQNLGVEESSEPAVLPELKPQLSSLDDFLLEKDEALTVECVPERELTPLERFQQRFTKHATSSKPKVIEEMSNVDEKAPLVSQELAAQLVDKPGAIRQHLRSKLREQLSQRRAEERKAAEEVRQMYSEELPDEEEEEMTDVETTDEEYEQGDEGAAMESDACSDLDQEEQIDKDNSPNATPTASNQNSDNSDSEDDIAKPSLVKKKSTGLRILDSDEEDDPVNDENTQPVHSNKSSASINVKTAPPSLSTEHSMSLFDATTTDTSLPKMSAALRSLQSPEEASMPPLMLNISDSDNEDSNERGSLVDQPTSVTFDVTKDSGIGTMATIDEESRQTVGFDESACGSVSESVEGGVMGEKDSNLEVSFRWPDGPSLPPAQPRREDSSGKDYPATFDPQTQWEEAQALPPVSIATTEESQDASVDESTQFLDADGFLCLRKEKRPTQPPSALKDSLDPTQTNSPSELLNLCSGQFEDTQAPPPLSRHRHPSDSSTQGVRELLGLATKPKPVGLSSLLSRESEIPQSGTPGISNSQSFSQFNEVIGLCSGVFPTTQASEATRLSQSKRSACGTSDGQSSDGSDDERHSRIGGDDNAVLRWAKKQMVVQQGGGYYGDSENEDEDMPVIRKKRITKLKVKQNKSDRLAEFVESEAELSGSDMGPDEEIDDQLLAEEEEGMYGYGGEEGEQSDVPLSDSELWDQVNKAHMKHTLADDKADLRDIKERFLKEGDLFEDGLALKNGFFRTRRFAKQGSEAGSLDLFSEGVGEGEVEGVEGEELSSQAEAQRRKDRLEREEFMSKCREKDSGLLAMDEDSQSILSIIVDNSSQSMTTTPLPVKAKQIPTLTTTSLSAGGYKHTRGSFLKHDSNTLRRLSSLTAVTPKAGGVTNGRGFVFHKKVDSSSKVELESVSTKKPQTKKRLLSTDKSTEAKRPKLDRSISAPQPSSVFSMLK